MERAYSFLFVPGHRPDRFSKAAGAGAHRIVLDLEDAVGPGEKDAARGHVAGWLGQGGAGLVRVNAADTEWFDPDLAALRRVPGLTLVLPKAEPEALRRLSAVLPDAPILALVETVAGLLALPEMVRHPAVRRLAFGHLDFGADAGMPGTGGVLDMARFQIALHSRAGDLPPPVDGVTVALDDPALIRADVIRARELGFGGKLCIHPRQVETVNAGFAPSREEIDWAERITAAIVESGGAAVRLDGKMVDKPMITRAAAILAEAGV